MTAALALGLGVAWAALLLAVAVSHRPPPARLRRLVATGSRSHSVSSPAAGAGTRPRPDVLAAAGRLLATAAGRSPPSPATARRLGRAAAAGLGTLALVPWAAPAVAFLTWHLPAASARRRERAEQARLVADLPDVVDLLVLAVGSGLNVHQAVAAVGRRGTGPLAAALGECHRAASQGGRLADALDELPARLGDGVRPLVAALAGSERYGAPLGSALHRLADEVRRDRRRRAEEAARRVPVALLFPLVLCTLPAFALLTLAPLIAGALQALRL